ASGRVDFGGTGYAPQGEVTRHTDDLSGTPPKMIESPLRVELERTLSVGDRANNAVLHEKDGRWSVQGDPTEGALLVAARKAGLTDATLDARFKRVAEVPFSSERKLMTTIHTDTQRRELLRVFTKGAPDVLLKRCTLELVGAEARPLSDARRREIAGVNEGLAREALRTLGVAYGSLPLDFDLDEADATV